MASDIIFSFGGVLEEKLSKDQWMWNYSYTGEVWDTRIFSSDQDFKN